MRAISAAALSASLSIVVGLTQDVLDSWAALILLGLLSAVLCFVGPAIHRRQARLVRSAVFWGFVAYFGVRGLDVAARFLVWAVFHVGTTTPAVFILFRSAHTLVAGGVVGLGIADMYGNKRRIRTCFLIGAGASLVTLLGQLVAFRPDGVGLETVESWNENGNPAWRLGTSMVGRAATVLAPTAWLAAASAAEEDTAL
jgi:hypothetical protein